MQGRERISLCIPREVSYLQVIRRAVTLLAERRGFGPAKTSEIEMAVDEACANAIRHGDAPCPIGVEAWADERGIGVTVQDGGGGFSFDAHGNQSMDAYLEREHPGGLGVYIIKRFMDEVSYVHEPERGSRLSMRKYLTA